MKKMSLSIVIAVALLLLTACSDLNVDTKDSGNAEETDNEFEGMEVDLEILENFEADNTSLLKATVLNNTDETFQGNVTVRIGLESWEIESLSLPPDKEVTKQFRHKYIKHPEDGYRYEFDGEFTDEVYTSDIEYELFDTDTNNSFNVRMKEINRETVNEVVKELYGKYGSNIIHVAFFGEDTDLENYDYSMGPEAEYYGGNQNYITVDLKKYDFEP